VNYDEFLVKIRDIKNMGFVISHRSNDTGIGKTLEDLLGITENNIAGPDFDLYELKSARKNTSSMLTLFTKVPQPRNANRMLLDIFGYKKRKKRDDPNNDDVEIIVPSDPVKIGDKELHITVDSTRYNSIGLKLGVINETLYLLNEKNVEIYYEKDYLLEAFNKKYSHKLIYVLADRQKEKNQPEKFWYNEAFLLEDIDFDNFMSLISSGTIKLDIRIGHYPNGKPHDHGTGFRILPRDLPKCFRVMLRLM
jgi:hypothetical protein